MLFAGLAKANTIPPDPGMIIVGETFQVTYAPLGPDTAATFPVTFGSCFTTLGSGFFGDGCAFFENQTGKTFSSFGLSITYNPANNLGGLSLGCKSNDTGNPMDSFPNNNCPPTVPTTNPFSVVFFGGTGIPTEPILLTAITNTAGPSDFAIVAFGWGLNGGPGFPVVEATPNAPVPEPATLALLLTGIGAIAARRKLRKARGSRA